MDVFEALADPTRRQVVALLGERPHRAGELAWAAGTSSPVMSRHLRILLQAHWNEQLAAFKRHVEQERTP